MALFNLHFHFVWTIVKRIPFLLGLHISLVWNAIKHFPSLAFDDVLHIIIMLGCATVYIKRMERLEGLLHTVAEQKRLSSFSAFNRQYCSASFLRTLMCGCVLVGSAIQLMAEGQQSSQNANSWGLVETFLSVAVVYTLSGLALMLLFTHGLWSITTSPRHVERWMQHATLSLDNKYFNIAIALATPDAWTKAGVLFLVASLITSKVPVTQSINQEEGKGSMPLRYFTLSVGAVVVIHSLFMAYIFRRLTPAMNDGAATRRRRTRSLPA